jgi:hypothetical protein
MPITRTFTAAELLGLGVNYRTEHLILDEILEADDGKTLHNLVFRLDGQAWEITYRHHEMEGVYFDDDEVTATAVEQREVTVTQWLPVEGEAG